MRRADRLMKIAHFLRQSRLSVTAQTIAEEFEICTRTVYRDINDLVSAGAPIIGEAGVGYTIDKSYYLPPISFDLEELEALCLGVALTRQRADGALAASAEKALEKIQAVLPKDLQGARTMSHPFPNLGPSVVGEDYSQWRDLIRKQHKVDVNYVDESGSASHRTLWPLALIYCGPSCLLAAWCELRQDFRSFRLDRMQSIAKTGDVYPDDPNKNWTAFTQRFSDCQFDQ